jgi:large subunit ribosomal protein L13
MQTTYTTKAGEVPSLWYLVDADGKVLGRMASEVAALLRGKWKTRTCPYLDVGDHVVVINAKKIRLTGRKPETRLYFHHTGWLGSGRTVSLRHRMEQDAAEVVRDAIRGMLPHTPLGRQMIRKLKVYVGSEHPHEAQKPIPIQLGLHGRGYPGQTGA